MSRLMRALSVMLSVLLIFSTVSCVRTVEVPVAAPTMACPLPDWRPAPELDAVAVDGYVRIPWQNARDLGVWIGEVTRRNSLAQVCLDTRSFKAEDATPAKPYEVTVETYVRAALVNVDYYAGLLKMQGVEAPVTWRKCGYANAAYLPDEKRIEMCLELMEYPIDYVRFVVVHEMAHALMIQRNLIYTTMYEFAADELATLILLQTDNAPTVAVAAVEFYKANTTPRAAGEHPTDRQRAWHIKKLYDGWAGNPWYSNHNHYKTAVSSWLRILTEAEGQ